MNNSDIKKMLKDDVRWASKNGYRIQMSRFGTRIDENTEKWIAERSGCGLCAIGSNLARNNSKTISYSESDDFQRVIRRSDSFTSGLVSGTDPNFSKKDAEVEAGWYDNNSQKKAFLDGFGVGREVLDWVQEQKKSGKIK
jgi:hypothetical protein